jgi:hypothetical protein
MMGTSGSAGSSERGLLVVENEPLPRTSVAQRRLVVALFAVGLTLRLVLLGVTPPFAAPDEVAHFRYLRYIATHHALPIQHARMGQTPDYEDYQPPLYYVISAPVYASMQRLTGDEAETLRALRYTSLLWWVATFACATALIRRLRLEGTLTGTVAIGLVALLPTYIALSTDVTNDGLAVALSTAALMVAANPVTRRAALTLGLLTGLALLAKLTALALVPTVVVWLSLRRIPARRLLIAGVTAAAVVAPFLVRNLLTYGDLTAEKVANIPYQWPGIATAIRASTINIIPTFWSTYGPGNGVSPFSSMETTLTIALCAAAAWAALSRRRIWRPVMSTPRGALLCASAAGAMAAIALTVRFGLLYDQPQGRYLFPLLVPLGLVAGAALEGLGLSRARRYVVPLCALALVVYALACVSVDLASVGAPWPEP